MCIGAACSSFESRYLSQSSLPTDIVDELLRVLPGLIYGPSIWGVPNATPLNLERESSEKDPVLRFEDPLWGTIKVEYPISELFFIKLLTRTGNIKQLGSTQLKRSGATHSRLAHQLGVYHLSTNLYKCMTKDIVLKDKILEIIDSSIKTYWLKDQSSHEDKTNSNKSSNTNTIVSKYMGDIFNRLYEALVLDSGNKIVGTATLIHDVGHGGFSHALDSINKIALDRLRSLIERGDQPLIRLFDIRKLDATIGVYLVMTNNQLDPLWSALAKDMKNTIKDRLKDLKRDYLSQLGDEKLDPTRKQELTYIIKALEFITENDGESQVGFIDKLGVLERFLAAAIKGSVAVIISEDKGYLKDAYRQYLKKDMQPVLINLETMLNNNKLLDKNKPLKEIVENILFNIMFAIAETLIVVSYIGIFLMDDINTDRLDFVPRDFLNIKGYNVSGCIIQQKNREESQKNRHDLGGEYQNPSEVCLLVQCIYNLVTCERELIDYFIQIKSADDARGFYEFLELGPGFNNIQKMIKRLRSELYGYYHEKGKALVDSLVVRSVYSISRMIEMLEYYGVPYSIVNELILSIMMEHDEALLDLSRKVLEGPGRRMARYLKNDVTLKSSRGVTLAFAARTSSPLFTESPTLFYYMVSAASPREEPWKRMAFKLSTSIFPHQVVLIDAIDVSETLFKTKKFKEIEEDLKEELQNDQDQLCDLADSLEYNVMHVSERLSAIMQNIIDELALPRLEMELNVDLCSTDKIACLYSADVYLTTSHYPLRSLRDEFQSLEKTFEEINKRYCPRNDKSHTEGRKLSPKEINELKNILKEIQVHIRNAIQNFKNEPLVFLFLILTDLSQAGVRRFGVEHGASLNKERDIIFELEKLKGHTATAIRLTLEEKLEN